MSETSDTARLPAQTLTVYPAEVFRVTHGVNLGEPVGPAAEAVLEDIYSLSEGARPTRIALLAGDDGALRLAPNSPAGTPGAPAYLDCLATFMGPHGGTLEAIVIIETDPQSGMIRQSYLHPLAPVAPATGYSLVTLDAEAARARLAGSACASFTRGTRITMADGRQCPIEDIRPGDRVLTRDSGPQEVRWISEQTLRATGQFAPIEIAAGALNNRHALTVSPNHRLFVYQRSDALGTGRRELLVRAALLVNATTVRRAEGGFVDYFQILFDKHEIIYAEGIAAESLYFDDGARGLLPEALRESLPAGQAEPLYGRAHDLGEAELAKKRDPAALLKRASRN